MSAKSLRIILWGLVTLTAIAVGAVFSLGPINPVSTLSGSTGVAAIGGPFTMTDTDGNTVQQKDLLGRPVAMFFGFASCPDVCPATMLELTAAVSQLDKSKAERLDIVFVSVDHERDTPDFLGNYLSVFESEARIRGFSGNEEQVAKIAKAYRVFYKKNVQDDGDYLYDHTASTFLFNAEGGFEGTIAFQEKPSIIVDKLTRLLGA